ncbi:SRPBCC family protein [Micromonospora sp. CPCC 205539]|uniref:SRPBCC family protein n=1 Tax=Micromonospora sp. CPCC 205539 TaxID=3122408 RepID=UPI002FF2960E
MAPLISTIEIARPPQEVFAFAADPRHFAEWQRDVVSVRVLDAARFTTTRRIGGTERTMTQRITRNDPPSYWAAQGVDGPIRPAATISVEPINGGAGSRVTFTLDIDGHGLGVPIVPLVRRQAQKSAPASHQKLKELLEGRHGRPVPPANAGRDGTAEG